MNNIDLVNTFIQESILTVLDKLAPVKLVQPNSKQKSWVTQETREEIEKRDKTREQARITQEDVWWDKYRKQRNKCVKLVRNDKKKLL